MLDSALAAGALLPQVLHKAHGLRGTCGSWLAGDGVQEVLDSVLAAGALLQVCLAAVPLIALLQRPVVGQVHAAMGAAHHLQRRIEFLLWVRLLASFEFAPQPERGGDQGDPEK